MRVFSTCHPHPRKLIADRLATTTRPPERLSFDKWLPKYGVLIDGPHAGELWSAEGAPYLPGIAACLSDDHPCNLVSVRKCQQSGASILALLWCIYCAEREPANMLYGVPGIDALKALNNTKFQPLVDAFHRHVKRTVFLPQMSRSGDGSTTYSKRFAGGFLKLGNANSVMDFSMITVRKGVKDEVSKWQDIPGFGDPEELFFGRFIAGSRTGKSSKSRRRKLIPVSTISTAPRAIAGSTARFAARINGSGISTAPNAAQCSTSAMSICWSMPCIRTAAPMNAWPAAITSPSRSASLRFDRASGPRPRPK
jgi:phage terminase large subunit GpA-like protein